VVEEGEPTLRGALESLEPCVPSVPEQAFRLLPSEVSDYT
jgi:hypothetical protein